MLVDQSGLLSGKQKAPRLRPGLEGWFEVDDPLRDMRIRQKILPLSLIYNTKERAVAGVRTPTTT
jgi:hypothetical protein